MTTLLLAAGLALSGCALLNGGPPRDENGRVTESTTISGQDLKKGDCFTFNSADGGIVSEVTVMPCSAKHDYLVLAQGSLTTAAITAAGSLQNAVSTACSAQFITFSEANTSEVKPKQEFLVFDESEEKGANQLYSCISTDPGQTGPSQADPKEVDPNTTEPGTTEPGTTDTE